jgi:hypothetical protein
MMLFSEQPVTLGHSRQREAESVFMERKSLNKSSMLALIEVLRVKEQTGVVKIKT